MQAFDQVGKLERLEGLLAILVRTSTVYHVILLPLLWLEDNLVPESFDYLDNQKSSRCMPENAAMEKECDTRKLCPGHGQRFRGFLPVVVDVETAGFNALTDALLEIACIPIVYDAQGQFVPGRISCTYY